MSTPEIELDRNRVSTSSEPQSTDSSRSRPRSLRPLVLRVHFYAGILVAPLILVAAITGGLYAVAPLLERVVYHDILTVDGTGDALPLSKQATAAQSAFPNLEMSGMRPAASAVESTRVYFADTTVGAEKQRAGIRRSVHWSGTWERTGVVRVSAA